MELRTETPQETLRRLQADANAVVTPVLKDSEPSPEDRRRPRGTIRRRSVLRLVVTALFGLGALLVGGAAAVAVAEMAIFGEAVPAEVVSVTATAEGTNQMVVEYPVDGVAHRGIIDEKRNVPQPGQSLRVVYDTRDVSQVAEAPTGVDFAVLAALLGFGLYCTISAARGFYLRRGSQWLPG